MLFTALTVKVSNHCDRLTILDDLYPHIRKRIRMMINDTNPPTQEIIASVVCSFARVGLEDPMIYKLIDTIDTELKNSSLAAIIHGLGKLHSIESLNYINKYLRNVIADAVNLLPLHVSNILNSLATNVDHFVKLDKSDGFQTFIDAIAALSLNILSKYTLYSHQLLSSAITSYTLICECICDNVRNFDKISQKLHMDTVKDVVIECSRKLSIGNASVCNYEGIITFATSPVSHLSVGEYTNVINGVIGELECVNVKALSRLIEANTTFKNQCIQMAINGSIDELNYKNYIEHLDDLDVILDKFVELVNNEAWLSVVKNDKKYFAEDKISLASRIINEFNQSSPNDLSYTDLMDNLYSSTDALSKFNVCGVIKSIANAIDYLNTTNKTNFTPFLYNLIHKLIPVVLQTSETNEIASTACYLCEKKICMPLIIDHALSHCEMGYLKIKLVGSLKNVPYKLNNSALVTEFGNHINEMLVTPFPPQLEDILNCFKTLQQYDLLEDQILNLLIDTILSWRPTDSNAAAPFMMIQQLLQLTRILLTQVKNYKSGVDDMVSLEYQKNMGIKLIEWTIELLHDHSGAIILSVDGYDHLVAIIKQSNDLNYEGGGHISGLLLNLIAKLHMPIEVLYNLADIGYFDRIIQSVDATVSTFSVVESQGIEINGLRKHGQWNSLCKLAYIASHYLSSSNDCIRDKAEALIITVLDMLARADTDGVGSDIIVKLCG